MAILPLGMDFACWTNNTNNFGFRIFFPEISVFQFIFFIMLVHYSVEISWGGFFVWKDALKILETQNRRVSNIPNPSDPKMV